MLRNVKNRRNSCKFKIQQPFVGQMLKTHNIEPSLQLAFIKDISQISNSHHIHLYNLAISYLYVKSRRNTPLEHKSPIFDGILHKSCDKTSNLWIFNLSWHWTLISTGTYQTQLFHANIDLYVTLSAKLKDSHLFHI